MHIPFLSFLDRSWEFCNIPQFNNRRLHRGLTTTRGCLFGFVCKKTAHAREINGCEKSSQRAPPFFSVNGGNINYTRLGLSTEHQIGGGSPWLLRLRPLLVPSTAVPSRPPGLLWINRSTDLVPPPSLAPTLPSPMTRRPLSIMEMPA